MSSLNAQAHVAELLRVAEQRRALPSTAPRTVSARATPAAAALRLAGPDAAHLARELAELDSAPALGGQVLLALLRLRAEHISGRRSRRRWPIILRPRLA